jgi:hypothetical protein
MAADITVGETRAFLARCYGLPHADTTHYVIAAEGPGGSVVIATCCDSVSEAAGMLAGALSAVTGEPVLAPESRSVIVSRDDLSTILADAWMLSGNPGAFNRLAVAAGLLEPPAASAEATP